MNRPSIFVHHTRPLLLLACAIVLAISHLTSRALAQQPGDASQPIAAMELAARYKENTQSADTSFRGRRISVTGTLQRVDPGNNANVVAYLYLSTAPGLPLVKLELARMEDYQKRTSSTGIYTVTQQSFEFRVSDRSRLEVRPRHTVKNTDPYYYYYYGRRRSTSTVGDWINLVAKGEAVQATGQCEGKLVDIVLSDSSIIKNAAKE